MHRYVEYSPIPIQTLIVQVYTLTVMASFIHLNRHKTMELLCLSTVARLRHCELPLVWKCGQAPQKQQHHVSIIHVLQAVFECAVCMSWYHVTYDSPLQDSCGSPRRGVVPEVSRSCLQELQIFKYSISVFCIFIHIQVYSVCLECNKLHKGGNITLIYVNNYVIVTML